MHREINKYNRNYGGKIMGLKEFPIEKIRAQFPALKRVHNGKKVAYFDGPGGAQVVEASIEAICNYMRRGGANLHGQFPSSIETEETIKEAKEALADLLGVKAKEIALGANTTTLAFAIARALGRDWKEGDEIVVSEIDHRAGADPWITIAEEKGVKVRWLEVNTETFTLELSDLDNLVNNNTVLVGIALASNAIGTINDVKRIAARAKEVGAMVAVDAVHAAPHIAIDRDELNADILLCSVYKFFGPHIGVATIRAEAFENLKPYKLYPAPKYFPDKLETGTQNHEGIAGIKPAIEFIASLGEGTTRRAKILSAFEKIEVYENSLADKIRRNLKEHSRVTVYEAPENIRKTPTIAFRIDGISPQQVCKYVIDNYSVFIAEGDFYATTLANKLDVNKDGGWVRAGLAPYNTEEEVDRFIDAIKTLLRTEVK